MEQIIDINYDWQYKQSFEEADLDILTGKVQVVALPHISQSILDKYKNEQITSYYEKRIEIMKVEEDEENVFLCFEGIKGEITLYINGLLAGERHSKYGSFEVNITRFVKYNAFNKISLIVKHEAGAAIYGLAKLKRKATAYIDHVAFKTKNILEVDKEVEVAVTISGLIEGMNVQAAIMDAKGNVVANAVTNPLRSLEVGLSMQVRNAEYWDVEDPVLYQLHIFLQYEAYILDEVQIPFGFREAVFKKDGFYLNGRKIKLCGVTRGCGLEMGNYKPFPVLEEADAITIKRDLGMNIVKIGPESLSLSFIKKCEEIGLLTFLEMPQWTPKEEVLDAQSVYVREMTSFIKAHRNYTSLVLWGLHNNAVDSYQSTLSNLIRTLDGTRAIGGQIEDTSLIDVYTYAKHPYLEQSIGIKDLEVVVADDEIPYMILGHLGTTTKNFDSEIHRNEQALQHMRLLEDVYASERIVGIVHESFVDYSEHTYVGGTKKHHYTGLLDSTRQLKLAGFAYGSQQDYFPVMQVSSNLQGSEEGNGLAGGLYVYTNCDKVKVYRDELLMGEFYPDKENFPNLPHPPIVIEDYLGNILSEVEGYSAKEESYIKSILMAIATQSGKLSLGIKGKMLFARFLNKINQTDIHNLYRKYILNENQPHISYKFEGYKDEEKVITVVKGGYTPVRIMADTACHHLSLGKSDNVTPIIIKAVDRNGNTMPYINDVIRIETTGSVEIIGHTYQSLVGGRLMVYVKTKGEVGTGVVSIKSNELGEGKLIFQVEK